MDFLARWDKKYATYQDLCVDLSVREKLKVVLLDIELFPNESAVWIIQISPGRWRIRSDLLERWHTNGVATTSWSH